MEYESKSLIILTYRYKNAHKAITWLCKNFGFEKKIIFENKDRTIANAQLTYGNSMIMLATARENEFDKLVKHPSEIEGFNTLSPYIIVEDIEAHYSIAKAGGAEICLPLTLQHYGGGGYTCKDLEGYLWNFGSYNPWNKKEKSNSD